MNPNNRGTFGQDVALREVQTVGNSPEAFASFIKQDIAIWKGVAEQVQVEVK